MPIDSTQDTFSLINLSATIDKTNDPANGEVRKWVPSRFNARTIAADGTLVVWNSYTNAFSGFPPEAREQVEGLLHRQGFSAKSTGLVKYMAERGFIVRRNAKEFERFRFRYGQRHHRQDLFQLTIMASEDCNFRCIYCYEKFARGTMDGWVRSAIIRMVEKRAPFIRKFMPGYFGGEPLMGYEAICELAPAFLKLAEEHGLEYTSGMTTNAYLLNPDVFRQLIEWKVTRYQITLDGLPEDHDTRRVLNGGGPTFSQIFENLSAISASQADCHVLIRINFDPSNGARMADFLNLMKPFRQDNRFELLFYPIRQLGGENDRELKTCGELGPDRDRLETLGRQMGMRVSRTVAGPDVFGKPCYAADPYHLIVGVDGALMKCTVMLSSRQKNIVGRLRSDGAMDLDPDKFVSWCAPHFANDAACVKCFFVPVCTGAMCPVPRVMSGERRCPPDKLRIGASLRKLWEVNSAMANQYDLGQGVLLRRGEVLPGGGGMPTPLTAETLGTAVARDAQTQANT